MTYVNFYPEPVQLYQDFEPVPEGGYNATIEEAKIKEFKSGDKVIGLKFQIKEPMSQFNEKIVFIDIKIFDNRPKVKDFAEKLLNQICTVCNAIKENQGLQLEDLLQKPMHIHLGIYVNGKNKASNTLYGVGKERETYNFDKTNNDNGIDPLSSKHKDVQPFEDIADDDVLF